MDFLAQPDDKFRLGDFLNQSFGNTDWTDFRAAVAFIKRSGTKHVCEALAAFSKRARVRISVGIDSGGTSIEGLQDLIAAAGTTGQLWVFHNANSSTFHPKIYLFKNASAADLVIGSGNLTEGGLYTNYEASVRLKLDLSCAEHRALLANVEAALDRWSTPQSGVCFALDDALLKRLIDSGKVPTEAQARETEEGAATGKSGSSQAGDSLFKAVRVRAAPKAPGSAGKARMSGGAATPSAKKGKGAPSVAVPPVEVNPTEAVPPVAAVSTQTFLMTLQKTDVGYGQVTSGASRRSPEIFVPMKAVDTDPAFWGWPTRFIVDKAWSLKHAAWIASEKAKARRSERPLEKMDRNGVQIRLVNTGSVVSAAIWYYPKKTDLRIRHEQLRAAGNVGDILILKAAPPGAAHDYDFEVVPSTDARFVALDAACTVRVAANSQKRYGYI